MSWIVIFVLNQSKLLKFLGQIGDFRLCSGVQNIDALRQFWGEAGMVGEIHSIGIWETQGL